MSMEIFFHPMARREMDAAALYYESKTRHAGWKFYEAIEIQLQNIMDHPLAYPPVLRTLRQAPVPKFPYHLVFQLDEDNNIRIIAVAHQKRKPGYWVNRM